MIPPQLEDHPEAVGHFPIGTLVQFDQTELGIIIGNQDEWIIVFWAGYYHKTKSMIHRYPGWQPPRNYSWTVLC